MAEKDKYYKDAAAKDAEAKDILTSSRITSQGQRDKLSSILAGRTKAFEERRKKSEEEDAARKARLKQYEEPEKPLDSYDQGMAELDAAFDASAARDRKLEIDKKTSIASELKDLSKRGALTSDLLKGSRKKAIDAGISEDQFNTFLEKNSIRERGSAFSFKKPKKEKGAGLFDQPAVDPTSAAGAAQNVIYQKEFGTGLDALAAMQDPNYVTGSGSALRQPSRRISPASGRLRSASRRLTGPAAQKMALLGELARVNEPSIDTRALRKSRMDSRMLAAEEANKQNKIASGSKNMFDAMGVKEPKSNDSIEQPKKSGKTPKIEARERDGDQIKKAPHLRKEVDPQIFKNLPRIKNLPRTFLHDKAIPLDEVGKREQGPVYYAKDGNEMIFSEYQTMEFRDSNGNGIEDRREGIYRKSDYIK